ncbi:MAG: DUF3137 domain-containing protein [Rickettsiales bacterium]|nr:DUF3137 domain-containing protein [Rickettsiales bacterium]
MAAGRVQAAFYENKLLLMIFANKNRFEVSSIFTPMTFHEESQTILTEMEELFAIIDILQLDQKTHL